MSDMEVEALLNHDFHDVQYGMKILLVDSKKKGYLKEERNIVVY